jgi:nicotinamidase/pyrazinamidase
MPLTVFFDVDTQFDFVLPAGAMHVPGAERLLPTIARLNEFAAAQGILVLSTVDAHPENDSEFTEYAAHCIRETAGQRKPDSTLLTPRATLPEGTAVLPGLDGVKQVLVEKSSVDCFRNRNLTRLLTTLGVTNCAVYGVAAEVAVRHAAMGLLQLGVRVQLVTDAVGQVNESIARRARNEFVRDGGLLIESTALVSAPPDVPYGTTVR